MKIHEFIKRNDIKLSKNSRAYKLLQSDTCDECELANALIRTKAFLANSKLKELVYGVIFRDAKRCNEHVQNMDNISDYDLSRYGEAR